MSQSDSQSNTAHTHSRSWSIVKRVAPFLVSVIAITVVVRMLRGQRFHDLLTNLREIDLWWLLAAIGAFVLSLFIQAYRWRICLESREKASFWQLLKFLLVSFLFNNVGLGFLGGDVYRTVRIAKDHGTARSAFSVFLARLTNVAGAAMMPAVCAAFGWGLIQSRWEFRLVFWLSVIAWPVAVAFVAFPLYRDSLCSMLEKRGWSRVVRAFRSPIFGGANLWRLLLSSLAFQIVAVFVHLFLVYAIGIKEVGLKELLIVAPATMLLTSLPISVNGIGVRENCYIIGLGFFGVSAAAAGALSVTTYVGPVLYSLAGVMILIFERLRSMSSNSHTSVGVSEKKT